LRRKKAERVAEAFPKRSFPHGKHDDQIDSMVQFLAGADTRQLLHKADIARRL
jgi:phage terminase large subunit-like protein